MAIMTLKLKNDEGKFFRGPPELKACVLPMSSACLLIIFKFCLQYKPDKAVYT